MLPPVGVVPGVVPGVVMGGVTGGVLLTELVLSGGAAGALDCSRSDVPLPDTAP